MNKETKRKNFGMIIGLSFSILSFVGGFFSGVQFTKYDPVKGHTPHGPSPDVKVPLTQNTIHNQYLEKVKLLESSLTTNPENEKIWTELGNLHFDHGNHEEVIKAYQKSVNINPNNANVWTDLGVMYRRNKEYLKAIQAFQEASKLDPQHQASVFNTGVVFFHDLKDTVQALEAWNKLVSLNKKAQFGNGQLVSDFISSLK